MSREAVVALLSGLRDVSVRHVPAAVAVQQPKWVGQGRAGGVRRGAVGQIC